MALLILFGFVAGAATALSPCVLPVLPIALSAGATGGRRRPLGIVAGLAVSFTFATVALGYVIGSAAILYVLMLGGRRLAAPLARRGPGLQIAMGAVMVVVALAMLGEYDIRFQNRIASDLPAFLVNPSKGLEDTAAARDALAEVRGQEAHGVGGRAANH